MEPNQKRPPSPEVIAILDREWPDLRRPFYLAALKRTQNPEVAEDLVGDTYKGIRSGSRQWDRTKEADFATFAAGVLASNIANWRSAPYNKRRDRNYDVNAAGADQDAEVKDGLRRAKLAAVYLGPSPEEMAMMRQEIERAFAVVFDPKGIEYALLAMFKQGISDPVEQARILDIPVDEVRRTIQRVDRVISNHITKQRMTS